MSDKKETDEERVERIFARHRQEENESLAAAKAEAARIGKEPFDFDKLISLRKYANTYDDPEIYDGARKSHESMYYSDDDVMTLKEMADRLDIAFLHGH